MKERIKRTLIQREKRHILNSGAVPAAVLMPIFERDGEDHILFTKRTDMVEHHKGQISFPGGKRENTDRDLLQTALREAHEEIGLRPESVDVLGELDDEMTFVSNYIITPFAGYIPYPYPFKLSKEEVQEILEVPISTLLDKANFRQEEETEGNITYQAYFYHYGDEVIWGATARILKRFFDTICSAGYR